MKVGLNATCLSERPSGAKQRFIGIYNALFERMPELEFTIYQAENCDLRKCFRPFPNVTFIDTPIPADGRFIKFFIGLAYWRKVFKHTHFDVFEGYHLPFMPSPSNRNILTVHDIRGVTSDKSIAGRLLYGSVLARSLDNADFVVTVSESMRREILDFRPGLDVSVIYNGIDVDGFATIKASDLAEVKARFQLPERFMLTVGHFEKRKNYIRLIEALGILRQSNRQLNLVMVGNDSGELQAVRREINRLGLTDSVIILSGITDMEVNCLYQLAVLFVFPSFYEGFGIPVLEAMAANCPMVLSDIPVFREITQNRAHYFQYDNVPALVKTIEESFDSGQECKALLAYGKVRSKDFDFEKIAVELEKLYRKILLEHNP